MNILLDEGDFDLHASRTVGPLDPGASSVGTPMTITLPSEATAGAWFVLARADDGGEVAEATETNNIKYAVVNIGPDLDVTTSTQPGTVTAWTSITVSDTVKNLGLDIAPPSTNRFYLSVNSLLDAGDTLLAAERAVPALGFNATSTGPTSVAIPAGLSGRHYLIIVSDGYGVLPESKETNNSRAVALTINP